MIATLVSCSDNSDVPSGMKLVYGGDSAGYYFYAPEEWTVSNIGDIKSAYVSTLYKTSVSLAKVDPARMNTTEKTTEAYFFENYFNDCLSEYPVAPTVTSSAKTFVFGKEGERADRAESYTYSYEYANQTFGFLQVLIREGENYYIFTYSALLSQKIEGKTYFDYYYSEKVAGVIENFRFVSKSGNDEVKNPEYTTDKDGFVLVSDKDIAGFELWVPESFKPDFSSGIVSATHTDGSNITMAQATATGVDIEAYWKNRMTELGKIVSDIVVISPIERDKGADFGNAKYAFACEYTYVYNGESYHVYQIYCIDNLLFGYGYVFTYTAKEANYATHLNDVLKTAGKVKF